MRKPAGGASPAGQPAECVRAILIEKEGFRADAEAVAIKRVIAYQIEVEMKQAKLSKSAMAERMHTSRTALDRLLDPGNVSVTLQTLERAAIALGKKPED